MSKFKIKMKLTGFELEIEGSREDMPNIQQAIGRQIGGLLQPASGLITNGSDSEPPLIEEADVIEALRVETPPRRRKRRSNQNGAAKAAPSETEEAPIDWPRDISKFGAPSQTWKTAEKALWILYVAQEACGIKELSAKRICDTFNLHYRMAIKMMVGNVNRDLGALKMKPPAVVGEDITKTPSVWFLTEDGTRAVQKKISDLLAQTK